MNGKPSRDPPQRRQVPLPPHEVRVSPVTDAEHELWLTEPVPDDKPEQTGDRMAACLGMADLTDRERKVLALIAYHDGDGGAWPSQERLGELAAMPRPTVSEVCRKLRAKGRLRWVRGHGRDHLSNDYTIAYGEPFQCQDSPDIDEREPMSGFNLSRCQDSPDTNRKEPGASREVTKGGGEWTLCEPSPEDCQWGRFVTVGDFCRRKGCGWTNKGL